MCVFGVFVCGRTYIVDDVMHINVTLTATVHGVLVLHFVHPDPSSDPVHKTAAAAAAAVVTHSACSRRNKTKQKTTRGRYNKRERCG